MPAELLADPGLALLTGATLGLVFGILITALWSARRIAALRAQNAELDAATRSQDAVDRERDDALSLAAEQLASSFQTVASRSLKENSETFLQLANERLGRQAADADRSLDDRGKAIEAMLNPIATALADTRAQLDRVERDRKHAFGAIERHLESMGQAQQALHTETAQLVSALKRPEVRGQWGEITLRRLVELAGMTSQVDFVEQVHVAGEDGLARPDMVVHLPDQRELVVDVKTPLDAYLAAVEATDGAARTRELARYAQQLRARIKELSKKAYWAQFSRSPEFVVLFIPGDQFLGAALDTDPELLDEALRQKVILATPTSLIALLKAVAYGWRQLALADNAEQIRTLAEALHQRLVTFTGHLATLGRQLGGSVDAYNRAVGSLERSVLPGARKFTELGVQQRQPVPDLPPVEPTPRPLRSQNDAPASAAPNNDE
ncbi:MAG: DNA recombination protein RmuC [Pseudomonadota bacterium]